MIIVANVLVMNGGTTFLVRTCREFTRRGENVAILLLFNEIDDALRQELELYAKVFCLWKYASGVGRLMPSRLSIFSPIAWHRLAAALEPYADHIHVMGVFGLLFAYRMQGPLAAPAVSAGVYHQNEYLYETSGSYLESEFQRLFSQLPAKNVLFLNEASKANYERFYGRDYEEAPIIPLGIDLNGDGVRRAVRPYSIVSVGNLISFKTYNAHMIRIVGKLAPSFPDIQYDIYGAGPEEANLRRLISELRLSDRICLRGNIPYEQLPDAIGPAALFVGCGTSILEAAALGTPAMIGIESIQEPETYGFLSDVPGYSYNEDVDFMPKVGMQDLTARALSDREFNVEVGKRCRAKAETFSITRTVDDLKELSRNAAPTSRPMGVFYLARTLIAFIWMVLLSATGINKNFSKRRNQSY